MLTREDEIRTKVKENLENRLSSGFVPSLGRHFKGKVRDVHFTKDGKIIGVTSDRVSAFDENLSEDIPFKGRVLNAFSEFGMKIAKEIMPVAMVASPDPNVVVQDKYENLGFECVVRGYVWGSMAGAYEEGTREFCGIELGNELLRYQRLSEPLFTPATKAEKGEHDENVSVEQMIEKLTPKYGAETAKKLTAQAKEKAIALYKKHAEFADSKGLIFIDTKYEFGVRKKTDGELELVLIDEAGTPDSSRYCDKEELEKKWSEISTEMSKLNHKTVSELLKARPDLKVTEMSKQYLRDVLVARAEKEGVKQVTEITEDDVVETAYRYIELHERLIGPFDFGANEVPIQQRVMSNLIKAGYTKGGAVIIVAGSDSDKPWMKKIYDECGKYGIASQPRIASAHKQGRKVEDIAAYYNSSIEPLIFAGVAGGIDALGGTASWHSMWPVVSCPPKETRNVDSTLYNPPGSSNATCLNPKNVARFAAQAFGAINPQYHRDIANNNAAKVAKLEAADAKCLAGTFFD